MERTSETAKRVPQRIQPGLLLLLEAYSYAKELTRDVWDFAVEMPSLRSVGLSKSDLRWLACRGYVKHARETTLPGENGREFLPTGNLTFTKRTCFVLTSRGIDIAGRMFHKSQAADSLNGSRALRNGHALRSVNGYALISTDRAAVPANGRVFASLNTQKHVSPSLPSWDGHRHEFRLGHLLVKVFKLPSRNQETVLMAFEEEGWPPRIDDPLPPVYEMDPKRRLHDTIKSLNRRQKNHVVRFMGDGTGEGVRWELFPQSQATLK